MRWLAVALLSGCVYFDSSPESSGPDYPETRNTCPFWEGRGSVSCTSPGQACEIVTWEHDCSCGCGDDGWWHCSEGTIGSRCPQGAPDAGVPEEPPDASIDAGPCSPIEAELVGVHSGWFEVSGSLSNSGGLTSGVAASSFTFDFTGTTLAVTHERGPSMHVFTVAIDGGAPISVDAYRSGGFDVATTSLATGLANGSHTATVTCVSASCTVDVFPVTCN